MQKNRLKKFKHGKIVKPAFKYLKIDNRLIIDESLKIRGRVDRLIKLFKKAGIQTDRLNLASKKY